MVVLSAAFLLVGAAIWVIAQISDGAKNSETECPHVTDDGYFQHAEKGDVFNGSCEFAFIVLKIVNQQLGDAPPGSATDRRLDFPVHNPATGKTDEVTCMLTSTGAVCSSGNQTVRLR